MQMKWQPGLVQDVKDAAQSLHDSIEANDPSEKITLQFGFLIQPLVDISKDEALTVLRKYKQGLDNLKSDAPAAMFMELLVKNPVESKIIQDAQKLLKVKHDLARDSGKGKTATQEQAAVVQEDPKLQQATSNVKS